MASNIADALAVYEGEEYLRTSANAYRPAIERDGMGGYRSTGLAALGPVGCDPSLLSALQILIVREDAPVSVGDLIDLREVT